jgi:O-antigen ligase
MMRVSEICLISVVVLATLAFGGTEGPYFSVVQVVLLGLGVLLLATYRTVQLGKPRLPVAIPLLLVALVLLQIAPLPSSVVQLFGAPEDRLTGTSFVNVSIAPYQTLSGLVILLTYLAAFYLTIVVCWHPSGSRHLVYALLALGTFEACYGLFQYLTGWQQILSYVKTSDLEAATGTYINRDHYAGFLTMLLPFALTLACHQFEEIRGSQRGPSKRVRSFLSHQESPKLFLWLFVATILVVAIVFSKSRMGIISAGVATLLVITLLSTSGWRKRSTLLLAALFVCAALGVIGWIGPEPVITRFEALGQEYAPGGENRWAIWQDTLKLVRQHPWFGTGLGTFSLAYPSVQTAFPNSIVDHAHNDYVEFASELGLPAGLSLLTAFFYGLLQIIHRVRTGEVQSDQAVVFGCFGGLVAISLHSLADFNLHIPANGLVFAVVLGMAYANTPRQMQRAPGRQGIAIGRE